MEAESKTLQSVTEFETITTKKEVIVHLEKRPNDWKNLLSYLIKEYNHSMTVKDGKEYRICEMIAEVCSIGGDVEELERFRNSTYEMHHYLISRCIHNHILEYGSFPPSSLVIKELGLSRMTVYRHLKDGLKSEFNSLLKGKLKFMAANALSKLYLIGVKDNNASALKSFIELSGGIEKEPSTNINNYIQINNLKISKDEFEQLPFETIEQIEKLISNNIKNEK
ncbi:hypothetical protein [Maribacter sp. Hel_I_7]|uniref:hypothetical protein n=1 Tax=Maribacter sp. Hel_I_7 TaxID=1249997 RepID=UPI00047B7B5B|nr:hypothetical protein [Maribacter sp. Hel_I_7]